MEKMWRFGKKGKLPIADELVEEKKLGKCLDVKYKQNVKRCCGMRERDYEICLYLAKKKIWIMKDDTWKENMNYHRERRKEMKANEEDVKRNMEKLEEQYKECMEKYKKQESLLKEEKEKIMTLKSSEDEKNKMK
jgi:hypothetical protein